MNKEKYKDSFYEPRELTDLRDMIRGSAALYGSKPAFMVKDQHKSPYRPISYSQLSTDINGAGTALIGLGLKDKKIAIIGENSYEWVVAYFATVNGTGVVVPIDRELHATEVANLINRAGVSCIAHSKKLRKKVDEALPLIEGEKPILIELDADDDTEDRISGRELVVKGKNAINDGDRSFVDAEIDPEAMCSLLFTSGTTGMAKGVMLSHKNIVANVYNMSKYVEVKGMTGLSVLPIHHTYEMTCHIMTGIFQGCCLAICEGLKHITNNLKESNANVMLGVPLIFETIHKRIMRQAKSQGKLEKLRRGIELSKRFKLYNRPAVVKRMFKDVHENIGGDIKLFITGGAAVNPKVIEDFEAMGFPMIQGYGMTENSPILAVNRDRYSRADSAGRAMPGTELKIIDPDETGMGEILCKGPSVMIGYYDNEEETKNTIIDGWLYTGDYGRIDEDGFLYITGRKKSVIVTKNGKNVFPEEVEFYLTESDYIEEAFVHEDETIKAGDDTVIKAEVSPLNTRFLHFVPIEAPSFLS
ncbi:MAG: AMP-binding protein [Firmicutes bacterium]|nr:AMP-binding protein [Bacillota bacterium]